MPKAARGRRDGASAPPSPYAKGSPASKNPIFKMDKNLGQHILKNPGIATAIVEKASLRQSDTVLEVGPGTGNLTSLILARAAHCTAVEYDPRMAAELTKRFQGTPQQARLTILLGDVIKTNLPPFTVCISNTPYQISSPLVFKLLALPRPPRTCVLTFQREFALRLTAPPGSALYCRLSANVQMWAKCTHVMKISKANFRPPPMVESSVVRIEPKVPRPSISYEEWDGLLRIVFVRRNRTIRASFASKAILLLLEMNYKQFCSMNGRPIDDGSLQSLFPAPEMEIHDEELAGEDLDEGMDAEDLNEEEEWAGFTEVTIRPQQKGVSISQEERHDELVDKRTSAQIVRLIVQKVLQSTGLSDKRASKCDEADFLNLLWAFNNEGIHFN